MIIGLFPGFHVFQLLNADKARVATLAPAAGAAISARGGRTRVFPIRTAGGRQPCLGLLRSRLPLPASSRSCRWFNLSPLAAKPKLLCHRRAALRISRCR